MHLGKLLNSWHDLRVELPVFDSQSIWELCKTGLNFNLYYNLQNK